MTLHPPQTSLAGRSAVRERPRVRLAGGAGRQRAESEPSAGSLLAPSRLPYKCILVDDEIFLLLRVLI